MAIVGNDPDLVVSAADDDFHLPTSDDPTWIETVWFPFWLPEIDTSVYARVWFRPNDRQQGGAVNAWAGAGRMVAYDGWTEPFTGFGDLRDLRLANGFHLECLEPLTAYRIRHRSEKIDVDVTFRALMEPNPVPPHESPGMFAGHVEQPGRFTGQVRIGHTTHDIDCGSVRDRSWGPRTMRPGIRIGNAHGTSTDGWAFFAYVNPDAAGHEQITSGYWQHDGRAARLVRGERTTVRDGDFAHTVEIDAHDALGRHLHVRGRCANRQAVDAGSDLYAVLHLVEWDRGDATSAWGENHDIWSKPDWLATGRAPLPAR
ncbi:MAG: hypothetical protein F2754_13965 [Actinobacteria bacterium]|uniref:Unannotated protein n=1 Tax=freshwater metagenome TaxID=449393 RepID=A0A6J6T0G0_9ZZZZ|nr:hypothetical protein [Actinomycetota bacterium]MSX88484.1 hypothetical protein [Actinomycetota bacterium]MSY71442.1 hypothetical protein [Actinomycetota bacterium]